MPELVMVESPDWELTVWTRDQNSREKAFASTMNVRGRDECTRSEIRIVPRLPVVALEVNERRVAVESGGLDSIALDRPLFFENTLYEFEFTFSDSVSGIPAIEHRLARVQNAFRYTDKHGVKSLRGSINSGNDVGWLRLPVSYLVNGEVRRVSVSIEIFPVKMDMASDLAVIYEEIDSQYPLWRFALAEQTEQGFDRAPDQRQSFPLLWLSQFESIQTEFLKGVEHIIRSPHGRLVTETHSTLADRLKGRISNRLGERVFGDFAQGIVDRRYQVSRKRLSVDTPENRFIKMVLKKSRDNLARFLEIARIADNSPERNRLSPYFFQTLNSWRKNIERQLANPLFDEIGSFSGQLSESLVLQQKAGYSAVYRCWQKLKMYLGVLGRQVSVSIKSVAELYEVWCFLEVRDVLLQLGFVESKNGKGVLRDRGLEKTMRDGIYGAFEFERSDGVKVRLAHEPIFDTRTGPVKALITRQKPDIVLEASFSSDERFFWLFDAKYRIRDDELDDDHAPDDAINQMHRYRDALICSHRNSGGEERSRPVFGAFVLYPGFFNQSPENVADNPYNSAVQEIGIGAFPLVPDQVRNGKQSGGAWLKVFLQEKLGISRYPSPASPERLFVQDSARIPVSGMTQFRYPDLTMVVTGAPRSGRDPAYLKSFEDGSSGWYHMRFHASERENIQQHVMREIRYCAIAIFDPETKVKSASWLWHVDRVSLVPGSELTLEQTGKENRGDGQYWLFKLSSARKLKKPIEHFPLQGHHLRLCPLASAEKARLFRDITAVYSSLDVFV